MIEVERRRFEAMVDRALAGLPDEIVGMLANVAVVVEDTGDDPDLLGVYDGVPLTERGSDYSAVLPDRIVIYRLPICSGCDTVEEVVDEVRVTVVHELGHHLGLDDERLHELGW